MRRSALIAFALAIVAVAALRAQERPLPLRVWTFRLGGTELGLDVEDMDGDGTRDLVIAHMRGPTGIERVISIFAHAPTGPRFAQEPTRRWDVPGDACAFVAGDFDPAPGGEVALLCPSRVVVLRGQGEAIEVAKVAGFFDYPERGGLPAWDLSRDLDGDQRPELLVPTKDGYTILGRPPTDGAEGPVAERGKVGVPTELRFGPAFESQLLNRFLTASSRLRRLSIVDLDGDGRKDLVAYRDKGLARFLQRPDGSFPERPDAEEPLRTVRDATGEGKGKEKEKNNTEAFANVRLGLEDVDGDGRADLVATRTLGEMGLFESLRTQQLVFRGQPGGTWDESKPDVVVNLKGISSDPEFVDWDGDGRRDMVLSTYRMDMFTNVKRAIVESMSITYFIHLARPGAPLFEDDPDLTLEVDVPLEALEKRGGAQPVDFTADLDGDKVRDMVRRTPEGKLEVLLGVRKGDDLGFREDRPIEVGVERSEAPLVGDLDGDGKDELILEPFGVGGGASAAAQAASCIVRVVGVER